MNAVSLSRLFASAFAALAAAAASLSRRSASSRSTSARATASATTPRARDSATSRPPSVSLCPVLPTSVIMYVGGHRDASTCVTTAMMPLGLVLSFLEVSIFPSGL